MTTPCLVSGTAVGPGATPLVGVTVRVYSRADGTLLGTTTTREGFTTPGDEHFANVSLLVHSDDGPMITNSAAGGGVLTAVGNASISAAQSKLGGSSLHFDGSGDKVLAATSPNFVFGSGDFTLEGFVYLTGGQDYARMMHFGPYWNDSNAFGISVKDASNPGKLSFVSSKLGSSRLCVSTTTIALNTWYHIAVTRAEGVFRLFIDGVLESTNSSYIGVAIDTTTSNTFALGSATTTSGGEDFSGYIDEARVTKGVARYTATFTPPTQAFPNAATVVSVPDGSFSVSTGYFADEVQVVFLDPDNGTLYNDVIHRTYPVPV